MEGTAFSSGPSKALYYPHTSFGNKGWLKASLLYWDGIRRIVPEEYQPRDDDEVLEAKDQGFIDDTSPDRYIIDAEEEFTIYFNSIAPEETIDQAIHNLPNRFRSLGDLIEVDRIFLGKISRRLCDRLIRSGKGKKSGQSLYLPPDIGGLYMCVLSTVMAKRIGTPLITDKTPISAINQEVSYRYSLSESKNNDLSSFLFKLGIPLPSPIAMQLVDMKKVIQFNKIHGPEKARFRKAVDDLVKEAKKIDDPNRLDDFMQAQRREIEESLKEYRKAQSILGMDLKDAAMAISVPSALNTLGTFLTNQGITGLNEMLIVGGLLFSAYRVWHSHQKKNADLNKEIPLHYTLALEKEIK